MQYLEASEKCRRILGTDTIGGFLEIHPLQIEDSFDLVFACAENAHFPANAFYDDREKTCWCRTSSDLLYIRDAQLDLAYNPSTSHLVPAPVKVDINVLRTGAIQCHPIEVGQVWLSLTGEDETRCVLEVKTHEVTLIASRDLARGKFIAPVITIPIARLYLEWSFSVFISPQVCTKTIFDHLLDNNLL